MAENSWQHTHLTKLESQKYKELPQPHSKKTNKPMLKMGKKRHRSKYIRQSNTT
jgi:hypothetical protein